MHTSKSRGVSISTGDRRSRAMDGARAPVRLVFRANRTAERGVGAGRLVGHECDHATASTTPGAGRTPGREHGIRISVAMTFDGDLAQTAVGEPPQEHGEHRGDERTHQPPADRRPRRGGPRGGRRSRWLGRKRAHKRRRTRHGLAGSVAGTPVAHPPQCASGRPVTRPEPVAASVGQRNGYPPGRMHDDVCHGCAEHFKGVAH